MEHPYTEGETHGVNSDIPIICPSTTYGALSKLHISPSFSFPQNIKMMVSLMEGKDTSKCMYLTSINVVLLFFPSLLDLMKK